MCGRRLTILTVLQSCLILRSSRSRSFSRTFSSHFLRILFSHILFFLPSWSLFESVSMSICHAHIFSLSCSSLSLCLSLACSFDLSASALAACCLSLAASRSPAGFILWLRRLLNLAGISPSGRVYELSATLESSFGFIKVLIIQTLTSMLR